MEWQSRGSEEWSGQCGGVTESCAGEHVKLDAVEVDGGVVGGDKVPRMGQGCLSHEVFFGWSRQDPGRCTASIRNVVCGLKFGAPCGLVVGMSSWHLRDLSIRQFGESYFTFIAVKRAKR
jgi:hypothetical protein